MSLNNNDFLASRLSITEIPLKKESTRFNNWLETGNYNGDLCGIKADNFITHFGNCSTLPLIKVEINKIEVTSICDSEAARLDHASPAIWRLIYGVKILSKPWTLLKRC